MEGEFIHFFLLLNREVLSDPRKIAKIGLWLYQIIIARGKSREYCMYLYNILLHRVNQK